MEKKLLAICLMFLVTSSVIYEVEGHFLLKLYLASRIPRHCIAFAFFASKGMIMFVNTLQYGSPATREFKNFFTKFKGFISFIQSAKSSKNVDAEIEGQANELSQACSELEGSKTQKSSAVSAFRNTMVSMAKTLIEQKRKGPMIMTFAQKRELVMSMVRWTRTVALTVKSAAEKRGKSIDISSYGLDVDVNKSVKNDESSGSEATQTTKSTGSQNKGSYTESAPTTSTKSGSAASTKSGSATSSRSGTSSNTGSENTYSDTPVSSTPTGSPSTYGSDETSAKGNVSTKKKEYSGGSSGTTTKYGSKNSGSITKESGGASTYSDTTGTTSGTPSGSPTDSSSYSGKTSSKGNTASASGTASSGNQESNTESKKSSMSASSTTSAKQVETETSQEIMTFISNLEQKYAEKSELKGFFEKLKSSMSSTAQVSASNAQDLFSIMKSAAGKLSEAMAFVSSKFGGSQDKKNSMETCQEEVMASLKELQDIKSKLANSKIVTSTEKTEIKQTITKWEQVTTQFVETAASSSSSSSSSASSSQQSSGTMG